MAAFYKVEKTPFSFQNGVIKYSNSYYMTIVINTYNTYPIYKLSFSYLLKSTGKVKLLCPVFFN